MTIDISNMTSCLGSHLYATNLYIVLKTMSNENLHFWGLVCTNSFHLISPWWKDAYQIERVKLWLEDLWFYQLMHMKLFHWVTCLFKLTLHWVFFYRRGNRTHPLYKGIRQVIILINALAENLNCMATYFIDV